MVDDSQVAEPRAGIASRAVTAPASGGFPTPAAGSPGALVRPPASGAPTAMPVPAKRPRLRRFVVPVLILAALGYGGKTAYDYFVEGRFLISTDDAYVGADTSIIAAKAMGHLTRGSGGRQPDRAQGRPARPRSTTATIRTPSTQRGRASAPRTRPSPASPGRSTPRAAIIAQAQAQVASAAAQEKSAEADVERAALEYDRSYKLAQTNFGSQQRLEQATADRDRTVAALAAAKASEASASASLEGSKANLDVLKAQKDEAARQRNELVTALEMAERNLSFTRGWSPRSTGPSATRRPRSETWCSQEPG